jgi:signal transduction histidine kinase
MSNRRIYTRFHLRLFWSVVAVFVVLTFIFFLAQYSREKQFKFKMINHRLLGHNDYVHLLIEKNYDFEDFVSNDKIRTTVIDLTGKIIFDSEPLANQQPENNIYMEEIHEAMQVGLGSDIRRKTKSQEGELYFYAAKRYENYIIRSSVLYDNQLTAALQLDANVIFIAVGILTVLIFLFYSVMNHLGRNINQLKDFALRADRDEMLIQTPSFRNDELGEISRHIVQIYNRLISTRKKLQEEQQHVLEQIEEKDLIKRQLTQNISHELKTPVSSIQGYLETIINNKELPKEILDDFVKKSYVQSVRLSALLYDISTLTRLEEASEMIEKETVDMSQLLKDILNDVSLQLAEKNITVTTNIMEKPLLCYGNFSLLYSIFRNLIDNTITYAGNDTTIDFQCNKENSDHYDFIYSDNGVGIAPEHLPRIFERFYRVDKGRSRKAGGTGLGLAIVKNAVLFHGGVITARPRVGGGVEFLFSIGNREQ